MSIMIHLSSIARKTVRVALAFPLIVILNTAQIGGGEAFLQDRSTKTSPVISQQVYSQILNELFPQVDPDPGRTFFFMALRYEPSFHPESQITIRRGIDNIEVVEYSSLDGNIYSKLNEMLAQGHKEKVEEMAKSIRVSKRVINVPLSKVRQWHIEFLNALTGSIGTLKDRSNYFERTQKESVVLDGTTYSFWYKQGLNRISAILYDIEADNSGDSADFKLVQWMNKVRREVNAMSSSDVKRP